MRLKPPPGCKLVRDWIGATVRTRREMSTGMLRIPAGTEMTVRNVSPGLRLEGAKCSHCGVSVYVTRVDSGDVSLVKLADTP